MKEDDTVYLRQILEALLTIEESLQGVNEENFKVTRLLQDGAIRQIEIMGEAVMHISKETCMRYAEVPWEDLPRRRDRLIHDDSSVEIEKLWFAVQEDLPFLKEQVVGILKDFGFE